MPKKRKSDLYSNIINAIKLCGWETDAPENLISHPFVINIFKEGKKFTLRIYIWNLTHGGGSSRPKHEFRIQVTGINRFEKEKNEKALILGWLDELQLFAGFDITKHTSKLGFSPSMQIIEDTFINAENEGIATYKKNNDEIAVAFRPDFFTYYIENLERIHSLEEDTDIIDESEFENIQYRYQITSYGADYPVDSVVKRIKDEVIFIPPFQRNYVWDIKRASRFIESLILGLPVPGIFLSKEETTGRLLIIDGQQRLLSLYAFYQEKYKDVDFKLIGVQDDLQGKKYSDLPVSDRIRLDDSILHATIIKQDDPDDNNSSIYLIYERLNTGGKLLNAQEIRASIFYGEFNDILNEYIKDSNWRDIFGKPNERLKEQELILRFFALYYRYKKYEKPLKLFLNNFMKDNRNFEKHSKKSLDNIFFDTINTIYNAIGKQAFRIVRGINVAVFDAVSVGVAIRLKKGRIHDLKLLKKRYNELIANETFAVLTRGGTTDEQSIKKRIELAIEQFNDIP